MFFDEIVDRVTVHHGAILLDIAISLQVYAILCLVIGDDSCPGKDRLLVPFRFLLPLGRLALSDYLARVLIDLMVNRELVRFHLQGSLDQNDIPGVDSDAVDIVALGFVRCDTHRFVAVLRQRLDRRSTQADK